MGMVDVGDKPVIRRLAEASGRIHLSPETIMKIKQGAILKGDPLVIAEVGGMNAAKQTHLLIPHCHQIALDKVELSFDISSQWIEASCIASAQARTGVEMEALVGVTTALNVIWDMVKYLEKDKDGQYPGTRMDAIRVIRKEKGL